MCYYIPININVTSYEKIFGPNFPLLILAGCTGNLSTESYEQINTQQAIKLIGHESDYIILDVRTPEEYNKGHIPNAVNIPNETIADDNISKLSRKNYLILVYTNIKELGRINLWTGETEII